MSNNVIALNIPKKVDPIVMPKEAVNPFESLRRDIERMQEIHREIQDVLAELEELVKE